MLRLILSCALALSLSGCVKSQCDQIRARAEDCGFGGVAANRSTGGLCEALRDKKGKVGLDTFAACVTKLRCDDKPGYRSCIAAVSDAETPPCDRLNSYLIGCGLEPASGKDDCSDYGGAENTPVFVNYVDCVVQKGCVASGDVEAALDECRTAALGNAEANYSSCQRVEARGKQCGEAFPSAAICVANTTGFTAASVKDYAACYEVAACGDLAARAVCAQLLKLDTSNTDSVEACGDVNKFTLKCNLDQLPVIGTSATCNTALRGFTEVSRNAFANCLEDQSCTDIAGITQCTALLQAPTTPATR